MMDYYGNQKPQKLQKPKKLNTRQIIYIGELPANVDQYELFQYIKSYGIYNIESLKVNKTKDEKAYAYVKLGNEHEGNFTLNFS